MFFFLKSEHFCIGPAPGRKNPYILSRKHFLKLANRPLRMDGWKTIVSFWNAIFSEAFAVCFREGIRWEADGYPLHPLQPATVSGNKGVPGGLTKASRTTILVPLLNSCLRRVAFVGVGKILMILRAYMYTYTYDVFIR